MNVEPEPLSRWGAVRELAFSWANVIAPGLSPRAWRWCWGLVGLGIFLRVAEYLGNRPSWLDEGSLAGCLQAMSRNGFFLPLKFGQLAAPGFLAIEMVAGRTLGWGMPALRLFPLVCGVISMPLMLAVAVRSLRAAAVPVAVALMAVSDDPIYFASELKQYETDLVLGLACVLAGLVAAGQGGTWRTRLALGGVGVLSVWLSHSSAFVLAAVGTTLFTSALGRRDWRGAGWLVPVGLAWGVSFGAVYAISRVHLGEPLGMYNFWDFAFPPVPFSALRWVSWWGHRLLFLFVNPLDFGWPLGILGALPAVGLFGAGLISIWRRDRRVLGLLMGPLVVGAAAACARMYPFHGRLLLYVVPFLLLLIAEGGGWFSDVCSMRARKVMLCALFFFPTLSAGYHVIVPRSRGDFSTHGDNRPQSLDIDRYWFKYKL